VKPYISTIAVVEPTLDTKIQPVATEHAVSLTSTPSALFNSALYMWLVCKQYSV